MTQTTSKTPDVLQLDERGRGNLGRITDHRLFTVEVDDRMGRITLVPAYVVSAALLARSREVLPETGTAR